MFSPKQQATPFARQEKKDESKRVPSGSKGVASLRLLYTAYLRGLACLRKDIRRTRSISSKAGETVGKKSDSLIVPVKRVMTAEGRGGHISRSRMLNINHTGDGKKRWTIDRMKRFSYKPQPVRRTYIPKAGSNEQRPLGIPSYEDKLVQGVMRKALDEIYKGKFYDFSYGFREDKSCHQAIHEVNQILMTKKVNFVVDADVKGFFDNVNHEWLMKFLEHDIGDKNFLRYVKRFLKAGVMEGTAYSESDKGTPQGGLISPVLANIYLHYVLDMWFEKAVKPKCKGCAYIIRYADDFVCMFQYENEAKAFYQSLQVRLAKFGLELALDKGKTIRFGRYAKQNSNDGKTETFDFLGLTHINGTTGTGKYTVIHRTSKKKLAAKKQSVKEWLRQNIHGKPSDTIKLLNRKIVGHYRYYGVGGNYKGLLKFYKYIVTAFYKILTKRSQRAYLTWKRYNSLLSKHPIIKPKIYVNIWQPM